MSREHWPELEDDLERMVAEMSLSRRFEEAALGLRDEGKIAGPLHLSIGQEAVAVGACWELTASDVVLSTHRGHHHCIAKGVDLTRLMAELLGRETGFARGRGGSMHIADPSIGLLGTNGIVGGGLPIAAGAAYGIQLRQSADVVVCFFGEGAAANGVLGEVLNVAGLWGLPLVLVCENNQWVEFASERLHVSGAIWRRGDGYGVPAERIDGNHVEAVAQTVALAVERARGGEGPTLIEAVTYRWHGHHSEDPAGYQAAEELAEWREHRDPLALASRTLATGVAESLDEIAIERVAAATRLALEASPVTLETLWADQVPA